LAVIVKWLAGCHASAADLSARLAIVPLSQEARGLDAGPRLVDKLVGLGDNRTAAIVRRIADEERAHVAVGVVWFKRVRVIAISSIATLIMLQFS
jgi:uncharacterized ferritin-like protein (DUF455 family)